MRIIGGKFKGRVLKSGGKGRGKRSVRPTTGLVRGAIFNILGKEGVQGKRVLDLFAGTGALGLEALSRGAESVIFIESDRGALQLLEENISILEVKGLVEIRASEVFRGLSVVETKGENFNLIFADPPYA
ncbi:MAG: 16S rRNA (guanine(966)-N(2))-methyltransferase RsmD, partial [Deltaproteobacteria bacterium]|nr:16S rRNA (guanine(966)-N(2))-methyltransferase RsmD [Deltaproteobacteria bacterium]